MDGFGSYPFERRPLSLRPTKPPVKWFKEWVPQETVLGGAGKCFLLKWVNEETLKAIKGRLKEPEPEPEPEPTTEVLFLCSYENCGKTFVDAGALRKHSHIHGERQYVCHYEGCGRKFLDSSKLKRHFLIHTGERSFVCTYEGCGKAFSLDFNLRAHMKTHSHENYHVCPYKECGKRYAHEYKLKAHIKSHHEKNVAAGDPKPILQPEKVHTTPKATTSAVYTTTPSADRPYACPYEGCGKAYIHEYKLNLHLRREHPGHDAEEKGRQNQQTAMNEMDEASDQDVYATTVSKTKQSKRTKHNLPAPKMPPSKIMQRKGSVVPATTVSVPMNVNTRVNQQWQGKDIYEDDSEETEEDRDDIEDDGWAYREPNEDSEETEDED